MNSEDPPRVYHLDPETEQLLGEVLSYSEAQADCQIDEDASDHIRNLNRVVGERFGLEFTEVTIETDEDEEGNPRLTVRTNQPKRTDKRKKRDNILRLVSDRGDRIGDGDPELAQDDDAQ